EGFEVLQMVVTAGAVATALTRNDVVDLQAGAPVGSAADAAVVVSCESCGAGEAPSVVAAVPARALVGAPAASASGERLGAVVADPSDTDAQHQLALHPSYLLSVSREAETGVET